MQLRVLLHLGLPVVPPLELYFTVLGELQNLRFIVEFIWCMYTY